MPRLRVIWFGKRRRDTLLDVVDEYQKRLGHYAPVEIIRLLEGSKAEEAARALPYLQNTFAIALDERGKTLSTMALAKRIDDWQQTGVREITFVLGGADGLADEVRANTTECWSLSALTLPHRMALAVLVEQLYRAHTVLRGEPYHRP